MFHTNSCVRIQEKLVQAAGNSTDIKHIENTYYKDVDLHRNIWLKELQATKS